MAEKQDEIYKKARKIISSEFNEGEYNFKGISDKLNNFLNSTDKSKVIDCLEEYKNELNKEIPDLKNKKVVLSNVNQKPTKKDREELDYLKMRLNYKIKLRDFLIDWIEETEKQYIKPFTPIEKEIENIKALYVLPANVQIQELKKLITKSTFWGGSIEFMMEIYNDKYSELKKDSHDWKVKMGEDKRYPRENYIDEGKEVLEWLNNEVKNETNLSNNTQGINDNAVDRFTNEVQSLEIKLKGSELDLSHYDQTNSNYETQLKKLQQEAINDIVSRLDQEKIKLLISRLEQIQLQFSRFWKEVFSPQYKKHQEFQLIKDELEIQLEHFFIISDFPKGSISNNFFHHLQDAVMFKDSLTAGLIDQLKKIIDPQIKTKESLIEDNQKEPKNQPSEITDTKKIIIARFDDLDNRKGWKYAFKSEKDFNNFIDLLTKLFEFNDYKLPQKQIQVRKRCKTRLAATLGKIHSELSNNDTLREDNEFFEILRVLDCFRSLTKEQLYKDVSRYGSE